MKKIFTILSLAFSFCMAVAQQQCERLFVATDKSCYLAGERLHIRVDAFLSDNQPSLSKVAYIEIADQYQLQTQVMVDLQKGQGWAEIALPERMHSGFYQLTAYTSELRNWGDSYFFRTQIGVINGESLQRRDLLRIHPLSDYASSYHPSPELLFTNRYDAGSDIEITLPQTDGTGCAVSVYRAGVHALVNPENLSVPSSGSAPATNQYIPEYEGHIVSASHRLDERANTLQNARLSIIGKSASLFDGQNRGDGQLLFYTNGLHGTMPAMLDAFDTEGNMVEVTLNSPYCALLPGTMPTLDVCCDEAALLARANQARQEAVVSSWLSTDTLFHSVSFMSNEPDYFYDLNEYTSMNDIREILLEFVRGVKRGKEFGRNVLFTYDPENKIYSNWPALVLLDGMPVSDIDEILNYDAHLVRYVQIYSGRYTFGHACCQGIISFITRKGRLSNYKLSSSSHLVSYAFPQDHPVFSNYTQGCHGTWLWVPVTHSAKYTFKAPTEPGQYQVLVQGIDPTGKPFYRYIGFEIR